MTTPASLDVRVLAEAHRTRARLLRVRPARVQHRTDLAGACGLAALELALRLDAPESLRCSQEYGHAWNVLNQHVVDVTATQFNVGLRRPIFPAVYSTSADSELPFYVKPIYGLQALRTFRRWYEHPPKPSMAHVWDEVWVSLLDRNQDQLVAWAEDQRA